MSGDLRDRLRQLGVHKGAAKVTPKPKRKRGLEALIEGEVIETDFGPTFMHAEHYAPDHVHGPYPLGDLLAQPMPVAAQLAACDDIDLSRAVFIDTETTGLAGGTGTLAFLVGVGTFDGDRHFTVRQYFLRSPAEEPAMLSSLAETLDQSQAIVSFNGRGFDLPLLQTRFTLAHLRPRILTASHLDLLMPARRVWRGRLPSCALSSLEYHVLNVPREQSDVPGYLIPQMYFDYLATGDASEMPRVLYHNVMDILSMVSLSTHLIRLFDQDVHAPTQVRDAGDLYAIGKWRADRGEAERAEIDLRAAIDQAAGLDIKNAARIRLAVLYKQANHRAKAIELWEAAALHPSIASLQLSLEACVELAKYYEWHSVELKQAIKWAQRGLKLVTTKMPEGLMRNMWMAELEHRKERLERKGLRTT